MSKWEYDISFHSLDDLDISEEDLGLSSERVISCDAEGHCFFNDVVKPNIDVFLTTLNDKGSEGWELFQLEYHSGSMVCFWKRELS
jgi:hypothetical protein